MSRTIQVFGDKDFKVVIPDDARITFGPWTPPKDGRFGDVESKRGTLRIYAGKGNDTILLVQSGVTAFRDESVKYLEKIAQEVGATIWRNDQNGYEKSEAVQQSSTWVDPDLKSLPSGVKKVGRPRKKRGPGRPRKIHSKSE